MTVNDAKAIGLRVLERIRNLPLPVFFGAAVLLAAFLLLAFVGMSGPPFQVLYEGLTPQQGGEVIAALQKLGIPYQLDRAGTIIEVPAADVGRARLELASNGAPAEDASNAWKNLESAPMTASEAAVQALQQEAAQSSLEDSIKQVSGARDAQVMIAVPRNTPFLETQPTPKASVVMIGAPQPDEALGEAVARLVAGAVPGLAMQDVVVATGGGTILYPVSSTYDASRQLAIQQNVEAAQEAKIRALLTPILGAGNFRAAVSADIEFGTATIESVAYGPDSYPVSSDIERSRRVGNQNLPIGIPGALSNQPPGPTAAPLNPPAAAAPPANGATNAAPAAGTPPTPSAAQTAAAGAAQPLPVSTANHEQTRYALDQTTTESHPASWRVRAISVSVVLNQAALGAATPAELKTLIAATTTMPLTAIAVLPARFVVSGVPPEGLAGSAFSSVLRAMLVLVAAIALLAGLLLPLRRWLAGFTSRSLRVHHEPPQPPEEDARMHARALLGHAVDKVRLTVQSEPLTVARTLQKWLEQT